MVLMAKPKPKPDDKEKTDEKPLPRRQFKRDIQEES